MKKMTFSFSVQCSLKEVRDPSHRHVSQTAQITTSLDKSACKRLIHLGQVRNNCCIMPFVLPSPYFETSLYDDNSWVLLEWMCFWLLQLFEPIRVSKIKKLWHPKAAKTCRSAVEERHILQQLVGCNVVGFVCSQISRHCL